MSGRDVSEGHRRPERASAAAIECSRATNAGGIARGVESRYRLIKHIHHLGLAVDPQTTAGAEVSGADLGKVVGAFCQWPQRVRGLARRDG